MQIEEVAKKMGGVQYRSEDTDYALLKEAKESGIVIAFCASDDLIEFRGAIHDETGHETFIDSKMKRILFSECNEDENCPYFQRIKEEFGHRIWVEDTDVGGCGVWQINTDIPHATFDVLEDDYLYCKGIVFSLYNLQKSA